MVNVVPVDIIELMSIESKQTTLINWSISLENKTYLLVFVWVRVTFFHA
jgi:hypothetical protein